MHACLTKFDKSDKKESTDKWLSSVTQKLVEAKILVHLTFEFDEKTRQALEAHEKTIRVHDEQQKDPKRLESLLSFDDFDQLKAHRNELLELIKSTKLIREEDVMKIVAPKNMSKSTQEAEGCFDMLKLQLEYMGLAVDVMQAIGMKHDGFNNEELITINTVIDDLYNLKHPFDVESMALESVDDFLRFLRERKIIKGSAFNLAYSSSKDTIDELKARIKKLAEHKMLEQIENKISSDSFISQEEVDSQAESIKNQVIKMIKACVKISFLLLVPTSIVTVEIEKALKSKDNDILMVVLYGKEWREKLKSKLVDEKKKNLVKKHPDLVVAALMNSVGALKLNPKCQLDINNIEDYFKSGHKIPAEVVTYVELNKDMVVTFAEYISPWNWRTFTVLAFGLIQV